MQLSCAVCEAIDSTLTATHPPSLAASSLSPPFLLTQLSGKFISLQECESRPSGSFIRRIITFYADSLEWQGEYQHFTEPDCHQRSFTIIGSGSFSLQEPYHLISSAQKIDFLVVNATVTPHLDFVLQQLASSNVTDCGIGPWILNVPKDISPTNGCRLLALTIPNADFNILRIEHDTNDNTLLFLGQDYQGSSPAEISSQRPTSFQPALIQCRKRLTTTTTKTSAENRRITANLSSLPTTTAISAVPISSTMRSRRRNCALSVNQSATLMYFWCLIILWRICTTTCDPRS